MTCIFYFRFMLDCDVITKDCHMVKSDKYYFDAEKKDFTIKF